MRRSSKVRMSAVLTTVLLTTWNGVVHAGKPRQPNDLRQHAESWIKQGEAQLPTQAKKAIQSFEQALTIAHRLNDSALVSHSLANLAGAYLELAEPKKALHLATESLSRARRAGSPQREAWALDQLGNAWFSLGDHATALEIFRAAAKKMEESGDLFGRATALRDAGIASRYLSQYDESLGFLYQALLIFRQLKANGQVTSVLDNLGLAYIHLGAHRLAFSALNEAVEIARQDKNRPALFAALLRQGYLYRDLSRPRRAILCLEEGLAIAKDLTLVLQEEEALSVISAALFDLGQVDEAIEIQNRILTRHRKNREENRVALSLCSLGAFYLDRDPRIAAKYFQEAVDIIEKRASFKWILHIAYNHLAQLDRRRGRLDRAIQHYQRAISSLEEHRRQLVSQYHRATFFAKYRQVYEGLVEAMMEHSASSTTAEDMRYLFSVLEQAKARDLADAISKRQLRTKEDPHAGLRRRQEQVSARMTELQKRLVGHSAKNENRQQIANEVHQLEEEFDHLLVRILQPDQNPSQRHRPVALENVQLLIDEGTALITYLLTKEQLLAFVVTSNEIHLKRLPVSPSTILGRVQNYQDLIDQNDDAWRDVAHRLYAELFAPLREFLPREIDRLVIVADGVLHYLPFETLISKPARSEQAERAAPQTGLLLDDYAISYAPSATVLSQLKVSQASRVQAERADLLMFANPELPIEQQIRRLQTSSADQSRALYDDEGFQVTPIPYSAVEAKLIGPYVGWGSEILTGAQANERRIKTQPLDRFRIVHFATHGLISERAPSRSALMLAPGEGTTEDGYLQAREIRELRLASDLVVLSACETSRGRIVAGEGVQGLAQAFLEAGTQSVVAPLWRVNDKLTAIFMEMLYRHLADGKTKVDALRAAKLDFLRFDPQAAPRDWAPFILVGEAAGRIPIKGLSSSRPNERWLLIGGAMIAALVAILRCLRMRARDGGLSCLDI